MALPPAPPSQGRRVRVLFIPDTMAAPTSERTPTFLRLIRERHEVVGLPTPWDRILYDPRRARWPRVLLYALDKVLLAIRGILLARRTRCDLVFCETSHHALAGLGIARILGLRCVWDSHGNVRLFSQSMGKGRLYTALASSMERFLGRRVDAVITVSDVDADAYVAMGLPREKVHVIPMCVSLAQLPSVPEGSDFRHTPRLPALLFFGSFRYEPNREALDFVNGTLAPYLERCGLPCEIRIAGRDIPRVAFHPFLRVLEFVPDIHACIRDSDLCVVPVRRGVGSLTKVIDIMAAGTPVVLFDFAVRGIPGIEHGTNAYVAKSPEEFLALVSEALGDPSLGRAMADRARALIERRYVWETYVPRLDAILDGAVGPGREVTA